MGFNFMKENTTFGVRICQLLYSGLVQMFGSKIQDIFHNNNLFCQSRGYHQIGDQQRR